MSASESRAWLAKAGEDLAFARIGYKEDFITHACFLSQQSIEKSLKAFLIFSSNRYPRIHSLVELLNQCEQIDSRFAQFRQDCEVIDEYYVPTRYPSGIPGATATEMPSRQDANQALETAELVMRYVEHAVNP